MLSRVVLGSSLLVAGTAHADSTPPVTDGIAADHVEAPGPHRVEATLGTGGAGARYTLARHDLYLDVQAFAELEREGALAKLQLARFGAFGVEHDVVVGAGYTSGVAPTEPLLAGSTMSTRTPVTDGLHRRSHRFLGVYITDTVRFIRGLDVTGGLVIEQWQNVGGDSSITYGSGPPMDADTPDTSLLLAPTVSITGHVSDRVALVAQTLRGLHEVGPDVTSGRFVARARAFTSEALGTGVATEAGMQPFAAVVATVGYVQTATLRRASGALTYSDPRIVSLTARYDTDARLDALAVRRLYGTLSGFVGVADLLGTERQIHVGVRGSFTSGR